MQNDHKKVIHPANQSHIIKVGKPKMMWGIGVISVDQYKLIRELCAVEGLLLLPPHNVQ